VDGKILAQLIGEDTISKIHKYGLEKIKGKAPESPEAPRAPNGDGKKYLTKEEWKADLDKRFG